MLFNSGLFFFFFALVFCVYWLLRSRRDWQNVLLVIASFAFYGYWDWRFLGLLMATILFDYLCALGLEKLRDKRPNRKVLPLVLLSVGVNLTLLFAFKFFGLFLDELKNLDPGGRFSSLNVIIPIGISFYTFQSISYVVDVYRGQVRAERNLINYALYICFFPQLIAGPIERPSDLLPQIKQARSLNVESATNAIFLIILGLYMKVVVADNLMPYVVMTFDSPSPNSTNATLLGIYAAMFQIYGDFAGYSAMAVGLGLLLGFRLSFNFLTPYFAKSPQDFWPRWHVTGVNWFRRYVFQPFLGLLKDRLGRASAVISLYLTMILFALWHGLGWTFFIWGLSQATIYLVYHGFRQVLPEPWLRRVPEAFSILLWFHILSFSSIVYRTSQISDLKLHFENILRGFGQQPPGLFLTLIVLVLPLLLIEHWHWKNKKLHFFEGCPLLFRFAVSFILALAIVAAAVPESWSFLYYQF